MYSRKIGMSECECCEDKLYNAHQNGRVRGAVEEREMIASMILARAVDVRSSAPEDLAQCGVSDVTKIAVALELEDLAHEIAVIKRKMA
jgi:hypothetical protein